MIPGVGNLSPVPVWSAIELTAAPVAEALLTFRKSNPDLADQILVCEIPEDLADTEALTGHFDIDLELSVNCILVAGRRAGEEHVAACAVRATTRADVNHTVRGLLNARKASFMSVEAAVEASGMEYGGITPIGLPGSWRLLIDSRAAGGWACIGSGLRRSKLFVTGAVLAALPGAEVVEGLAVPLG